MASIPSLSTILTPLVLLDLQISDVDCAHNIFRRYYYYYYYNTYRNLNTTKYESSEFKGWYAGAAVGIVLGSMMFLLLLSVCMKYCIQKINRSRFIIKPAAMRATTENRTVRLSVGRVNTSHTSASHSRRQSNLHRQLESNAFNRALANSSFTDRHSYRQNERQNQDDVFIIERQLPAYREVCSPPPEYTENADFSALAQQEIDNEITSGVVSPPPSYREATEQRSMPT